MQMELFSSWGKEQVETERQILLFEQDDGTENQVINLYPQRTYQTLEGFGGAITDAAGYVFAQMNEEQQEPLSAES